VSDPGLLARPQFPQSTVPSPECSLRERKKQNTRSALHAAAFAAVRDRGVTGVTIEEISAAAGVSPRTFFNYFPSKAAAALGLADPQIPQSWESWFAERESNFTIDDACDLVVQLIRESMVGEHPFQEFMEQHEDFASAIHHWVRLMKKRARAFVSRGTANREARLMIAVVLAAMIEILRDEQLYPVPEGTSMLDFDSLNGRLRLCVSDLGRVAASVTVPS